MADSPDGVRGLYATRHAAAGAALATIPASVILNIGGLADPFGVGEGGARGWWGWHGHLVDGREVPRLRARCWVPCRVGTLMPS